MSFMYLAMTVDDRSVEVHEPEESPFDVPIPPIWDDVEEPTVVTEKDDKRRAMNTTLTELCKEEISGEFFIVELTPPPEVP